MPFSTRGFRRKTPLLKQQIRLSLIAVVGGIVFIFVNLLLPFIALPPLDFNYFALISLLFFRLPFSFITENYHLYTEKTERELEYQKERGKIMAELHDNLGIDLTNIKMFSEVIPKYLINNAEKAGEFITFIKETAKNSMEQLWDFLGAIDTKYTTG